MQYSLIKKTENRHAGNQFNVRKRASKGQSSQKTIKKEPSKLSVGARSSQSIFKEQSFTKLGLIREKWLNNSRPPVDGSDQESSLTDSAFASVVDEEEESEIFA